MVEIDPMHKANLDFLEKLEPLVNSKRLAILYLFRLGLDVREVSEYFGDTRQTMQHYIDDLRMDEMIVRTRRDERKGVYTLSPVGELVIDSLMPAIGDLNIKYIELQKRITQDSIKELNALQEQMKKRREETGAPAGI